MIEISPLNSLTITRIFMDITWRWFSSNSGLWEVGSCVVGKGSFYGDKKASLLQLPSRHLCQLRGYRSIAISSGPRMHHAGGKHHAKAGARYSSSWKIVRKMQVIWELRTNHSRKTDFLRFRDTNPFSCPCINLTKALINGCSWCSQVK